MVVWRASKKHVCSFCGKSKEEVVRLIAGPASSICDRCVTVCKQILEEDRLRTSNNERGVQTPKSIREKLDEYVVGQDWAKRVLAVAAYNHFKRTSYKGKDVEIQKGNILLLGPSGCGKTHLARALSRALDVPFHIADATPLTQAGYVGEDVENILVGLLRAANGNVEKAQQGIIFLDEVDKLAKRSGYDRDVSGEGVQQGLLRILEGRRVNLVRKKSNGLSEDRTEFDTSNVLFIAGGAFCGLSRIIGARLEKSGTGFLSKRRQVEANLRDTKPGDLQKFGLIPEFIGRLPIIVAIDELCEDDLVQILTEPHDAILRQYQKLLGFSGIKLRATKDGLRAIARLALRRGTGARGLRAIMEDLLLDAMFKSMSGSTYLVDENAVREGSARIIMPTSIAFG